MRDGQLNKDPQIEVVRETPVSALVDGDGGLGYFPAYQGLYWRWTRPRQQVSLRL